MWLEISDHDEIIGVHSDQCESENLWVSIEDCDVNPGDLWVNGKVKKNRDKEKKVTKSEERKLRRRDTASSEILSKYPEWKQINIIRSGDDEKIKIMGEFIDLVRDWSNTLSLSDDNIDDIINRYFPKK